MLPCSVFKWDVMTGGDNFSLFITEPVMDQFKFRLTNLRAMMEGSWEQSWTLTRTCIDDHQILLCNHTSTSVRAGNSPRPWVETAVTDRQENRVFGVLLLNDKLLQGDYFAPDRLSKKWRKESHQNLFPHAAKHPSSNDKEGLGEFKEEILVEGVTKILVLLPSSYP